MIGCHADAKSRDIKIDEEELEEARWFERQQVAEMLASWGDQSKLRMPAPLAIAHQLARVWIEGDQ